MNKIEIRKRNIVEMLLIRTLLPTIPTETITTSTAVSITATFAATATPTTTSTTTNVIKLFKRELKMTRRTEEIVQNERASNVTGCWSTGKVHQTFEQKQVETVNQRKNSRPY